MSGGRLTPVVSASDHAAGPEHAVVTLVEYGDFECPYCALAGPVVKAVQRELGSTLRFVFRHFPAAVAHPHARQAAQAAEAAAAQGKFWLMHDMLLEHQDALEAADLVRYAQALDLDVARFASELAAGMYEKRVRDDFRNGVRSGVNGTPTFFMNGQRHDGSWSDEQAFAGALRDAARQASWMVQPVVT